jgi:hypothetical protein
VHALADKYHGGVPTDRRRQFRHPDPPEHQGVTRPSAFARLHGYCAHKVVEAGQRKGRELSETWREQTPRQVRFHSAEYARWAALAEMFGMNMAATIWLVRGTVGSDANGGTSKTVIATGTNGNTTTANVLVDSTANAFTAAMVGQGINIPTTGVNHLVIVTGYTSPSTITYSGSSLQGHSNITWNVGGAWATMTNVLVNTNSVAAGDSVYVGATVYRATLASVKSGSSGGGFVAVIGDVDGAQTGDAGQVTVSAYTTSDTTAPSATQLLALGATSYVSFAFFTFIGGSNNTGGMVTNGGGNNWTFTDCVFNQIYPTSSATQGVFNFSAAGTGTALALTLDRCTVVSAQTYAITITLPTSASSAGGDYDALCVIRNSFIFAIGTYAIGVLSTGSATYHGGGVRVYNSVVIGGSSNAVTCTGPTLSTTIPCEVHNSLIITRGTALSANNLGYLIESNNLIFAVTTRTNTNVGYGSVANLNAPLVELGQSYKWSGLTRPFLAPDGALSTLLGFCLPIPEGPIAANQAGRSFAFPLPAVGNEGLRQPLMAPPRGPNWFAVQQFVGGVVRGTYSPTAYDWANRPRPAGGGSNNPAVGYLEFHDSAVEDTTTTYSGAPASAKLTGPGDIDLLVPVDAVSNTFSVYVLYDGAYGGQNFPTLTLLSNGEIGVVSQVVAAPGGSYGAWQQVSLSAFTPTAAGFVKIRLTSYDTSGASLVHFDTFAG